MKYRIITFLSCAFAMLSLASFAKAQEEGFVSLFDGKTLEGWTVRGGDAKYSVEDACIVGRVADPRRNTFICTDKSYENFIFKVDFKFDNPFNSGIQFRSKARPAGDREVVYGYQYEMDENRMTGAVYDESRRNRWVDPLSPEVQKKTRDFVKKGDWNEAVIQCIGPSIKTWINGELISDIIDATGTEGFFGLQVHAAQGDGQVRWKNVRIKELPSTPWKSYFDPKAPFETLEVKPAAKWTMDDKGVVHGTSVANESRDGILLTKEKIPNFAAKLSFKQIKGNSGLYFRASEVDKPHWLRGVQGEIDALATGRFWEVDGRGWISPGGEEITEKIKKAFKPNEWNEFHVIALGDHFVTILNGVEIANILDEKVTKDGKLGIQLHGGSDMEYFYKDFDIMPISDEILEMIKK